VAKKKKKKTKKKNSHKQEAKSATTAPSTALVGTASAPLWKVKFPCKLWKDEHILHDCPGIPKILEVWSHDLAQPSSSSEAHGDATPLAGNGKEKGKIRIPCRLCEGNHPLHLCPLMDKDSAILESLRGSSPNLPVGYQRLSIDYLPTDKEIDIDSSLVQAPLPEPCCAKPIPDQPLVGKSVDSGSPLVNHSVSEDHHGHVLLISSDSPESKNDSPVPANPESPSSVPLE